jgi:adenylate kinase family enzyme
MPMNPERGASRATNVILHGHAGAGKSTLSKLMIAQRSAACLSEGVVPAGQPKRLPVVFTVAETREVLQRLQ